MKAYKGFRPELTCLAFQYKEGKTYHTSGVKLCEHGFHSCLEPLDVWQFYPPTTSVFHQVDTGGDVESSEHKQCTEEITIGRRLYLQELIEAQSDYLWSKLEMLPRNTEREVVCSPKDQPFVRVDGEWSVAAAAGPDAIAAASRFGSIAASVSEHGSSITTGSNSVSVVSGPETKASSIGEDSIAVARGRNSSAAASGGCSVAVSKGLGGNSVATGAYSTVVAAGTDGSALATGDRSVAIATGASGSVARAEGLDSVAIVSRSYGTAQVAHRGSAAIALGWSSSARGPLGAWLVLSETDSMHRITDMVAVEVGKEFDGQMIQPDVAYFLDGGRIVRG